MTRPTTIVVDLDGTLCNSDHRVDLALAKQWDAFSERAVDDMPHRDVAWLLHVLESASNAPTVIFLTGRNERYRDLTLNWLTRHDVFPDVLLMRPDKDFTPDHEIKPAMLLAHYDGDEAKMKAEVGFVLEDRDRVVEAWRNLGVSCWQVRLGSF